MNYIKLPQIVTSHKFGRMFPLVMMYRHQPKCNRENVQPVPVSEIQSFWFKFVWQKWFKLQQLWKSNHFRQSTGNQVFPQFLNEFLMRSKVIRMAAIIAHHSINRTSPNFQRNRFRVHLTRSRVEFESRKKELKDFKSLKKKNSSTWEHAPTTARMAEK